MKSPKFPAVLSALATLGLLVNPALARVSADTNPPLRNDAPITLGGETPRAVINGQAARIRAHDAGAQLSINISLPLRNLPDLQSFIANQASHGVYLTQEEFKADFGPTALQVQAVEQWANDHGLYTSYASPDGTTLTLRGSVPAISAALSVTVNDYRLADGRTFYANDRDPAVPAYLGVGAIDGLNDIVRFHKVLSRSRSVRGGGYVPADFRAAYDTAGHTAGGTSLDGTGQTIGLTLWGAPVPDSDLAQFASATGDRQIAADTATYPNADPIQWINENGGGTQHDAWDETAMDVEYAHGMAPHAKLKYYLGDEICDSSGCGGSTVGLEDAIAAAANDSSIHAFSNSWGGGEAATPGNNQQQDPFTYQTQQSFMHAVAVGTTFYFSTGDAGANSGGSNLPSYPADSPYVVAVGGTSLSTTGTTTYSSEAVWSGSGTGCSTIFARPSWQTVATGHGGFGNCASGRQVPDVATAGDPNTGANVYYNGTHGQIGGTSLAAPLFTGMMAAADRYASLTGHSPLGWSAPVIYNCGNNVIAGCNGSLHDVASGAIGAYSAGPGFDQASGWGSIDWWLFVQKVVGTSGGQVATPTNTPSGPTSTTLPATSTPTAGSGSCSADGVCLTGLVASAASAAPGTAVTLTAGAARDVGPTPWYIDIVDESGALVAACASGTRCTAQVSSAAAAAHTYTAWLSTSNAALAGGGPSTNAVSVSWSSSAPATSTPTSTRTLATSTPTSTRTLATNTPTSTLTNTPVPATNTPTSTSTSTPVPATSTVTNTAIPSTNTATNIPPPLTNTATASSTPTNTPIQATNTPVPATSTSIPATSTPGGARGSGGCSADGVCLTGLATSAASAAPGTAVTLTAGAARDVGPTPWYIDIVDESGALVAACASGTSCTAQVGSAVAAAHTYTAWLSTSNAALAGGGPSTNPVSVTWSSTAPATTATNTPTNTPAGATSTPTNTPVQATSTPVPATSTPSGARGSGGCSADGVCLTGLAASAASVAPSTAVTLTAGAARDVGPTPWYIDIVNESGALVAACASGTSCTAQVSSAVATAHTYTAWLSTSNAALAGGGPSTNSVSVSWR